MLKRTAILALSCAALLASAAITLLHDCIDAARWVYAVGARELRSVFAGPVAMAQPAGSMPEQRFVAARQFVARMVKRERPTLFATWRMCPSI